MTVDIATLNADQPLLDKIVGGFAVLPIQAANIQSSLASLQADAVNIVTITATGGSVSARLQPSGPIRPR